MRPFEQADIAAAPHRWFVPPLVVLVGLLVMAPRYGFHRDELYFMSNADHLAWGYIDHPPLTPLIGRISQTLFGDGVFGLRVLPAVLAAAVVAVTILICRELGGSARAQLLAGWAMASSSVVMALGHMLTTPLFDLLAWTTATWILCRLVRTGDRWLLAALGAVIGIGLLNRFTVLFAVVGFGLALLTTPQRVVLASRWTAVGIALGLMLWLPHLLWQHDHGWPVFEFSAAIAAEATENRIAALPMLALLAGPPVAIVVLVAWWEMVRGRLLPMVRVLPIGAAIVVALVLATGGKHYYAAGVLPGLVAAASVWWENRHGLDAGRRASGWLAASAAVGALVTLPVLPVSVAAAGPVAAVNPEPMEMIGWPEFVDQIAAVYTDLDDGRRSAVILTANYGQAGAIDYYGRTRGLPLAASGHNSYADVRIPAGSAGPILVVGYRDPSAWFVACHLLDPIVMPYGVDNDEQGTPLHACDVPRRPWRDLWPDLRHVD